MLDASKVKLITGPPQAGKTAMLSKYVKLCLKTTGVIIIVRNLNTDKLQLVTKLNKYIENIYISKNIKEFENSTSKSVLIIQWNKTQITKVLKSITKNFCLFTDESDEIGYKPAGIVSDLYEELKSKSLGHYEVTATPWDVLYGNSELTVDNIITVVPPPTFRGIDDYIFEEYSATDKKQLSDYINDYYLNKVHDFFDNQPAIILHRDGNRQKNHTEFIKWIAQDMYFNKIYTVIVEDGRGYQLFCPYLTGKITIKNIIYQESEIIPNYFTNIDSKKLDIQELLQFLKNLDNAKLSHIIIKTGNQAGRSRSYVSQDGCWHLTHQFLYTKSDVSIPDLIQCLRLSHTLGGDNTLELTAPRKIIADIRKGNDAIKKALNIIKNPENTGTAREKLLEIKWSVTEIPKANLCKSVLHKDINRNMVKKAKCTMQAKYTVIDVSKLSNSKFRRGLEYLYNTFDKMYSSNTKIQKKHPPQEVKGSTKYQIEKKTKFHQNPLLTPCLGIFFREESIGTTPAPPK